MASDDPNQQTRSDAFAHRHLGPRDQDIQSMLKLLGSDSLDALVDSVMPDTIRSEGGLSAVPAACGEMQALDDLRDLASQNQVLRSYIGLGYHDCITPPVILRTILENPGWYTQYTPYQAEISQGRLEALLTFQTMVIDLTGMAVANCSLLDEATAAAEAMTMCRRVLGKKAQDRNVFFVSNGCHPQTLEVVMTRAQPLGIEVLVGDPAEFEFGNKVFGALLQYPNTDGSIDDLTPFCEKAHAAGALVTVATDLLALTLLKAPGELGADVVVGNSQRFGVPMGYGGPHAAFMGARDDYKRQLPGRIIGVTIDATGRPALRMALQTREQHIRRDKATSNICTAQVLLAIVAATYAVYHGPEGLTAIARRTRGFTGALAKALTDLGCTVHNGADGAFFDTLRVTPGDGNADRVLTAALALGINLREFGDDSVGIAFDETVDAADVADVYVAFGGKTDDLDARASVTELPDKLRRTSGFLTHPVFHRYRSETELLRYLARLQSKDLSLTTSMIPLGSCTMKLNATAEMIPITWPEFSKLHPFAPLDQANGYQ
ncbi:MAG: aminomethyl-transferring glycine dehydrogenase, partial [Planctomycetota bacterium]